MAELRPYSQLQRTADHRWWRPLVALAVAPATGLMLLVAVGVWGAAATQVLGLDADDRWLETGPSGFLITNFILALAIPISILAILAGFQRRPGWLASVDGRMRWGWMGRCAVVVAIWAVLLSGLWIAVDGLPDTGGRDIAALVLICLLTTPFQAAGEEYMMRGWLTQSVGAWFSRPAVGAVVAGLLSATVFALLHGQQNPWLFGDRWAFGVIASYLVWATGGLEASIVLHAGVNIASILPAVLAGTLDQSLTVTEAPPLPVLLDVVGLAIAAAVMVRLARRRRIPRLGAPERRDVVVDSNLGLPSTGR